MPTTGSEKIDVDMEFESTVAKAKAFDLISEAMASSGFDTGDLTHVDTARLLLSLTFDNIDNYLKTCLASATKSFVEIVRVHEEARKYFQDIGQASESITENARMISAFPHAVLDLSSRVKVLEDMFVLPKEGIVGSGAMISSARSGASPKTKLSMSANGTLSSSKRDAS